MPTWNLFGFRTWKSSSLRSRPRPRRCRRAFPAVGDSAAAVLEQRVLLTGNITASVSAVGGVGSLSLTSDSATDAANVYRLDATHVEVDGVNGTKINGSASAIFAISTVTGITVNLGSGDDQYEIFSQAGDPALNVGAGGILFTAAGPVNQDSLQVFNTSSNAMTIKGSVTVRGNKVGSPLDLVGGADSFFVVDTASAAALTIDGSVSFVETGTYFEVNKLFSGPGNLTIGQNVTEIDDTGDPSEVQNNIYTYGAGNINIGGSVTQAAAASYNSSNQVFTGGSAGDVAIGGSVTQNNTGTFENQNVIEADGSSKLSIGDVTSDDSGASIFSFNYVDSLSSGSFTIGGRVSITESSPSATDVENLVETGYTGKMTIGGLVAIDAASSGPSTMPAINEVGSDSGATGSFSALGVLITDSGSQAQENDVQSDVGAVAIGALGVTILGSGSGDHQNIIKAFDTSSSLRISGSVTVIDTTTGTGNENLEIDGASIGGSVLVTMPGAGAQVDINNASGYLTTEIKGLFAAIMRGSDPAINVSTAMGDSKVKFDLGAYVLGASGGGGTFTYFQRNVTYYGSSNPIFGPLLFNFQKVLS